MKRLFNLAEKKEDIKKYCFIIMWTQLFPILIYIMNGYKNVGFLEVVKNVKAGARITLIITLIMFIFMIISPRKILKKIGVGLILFNLLVNIPDLFTYINFGTQINSDIFFIFLETNKNEGIEFFKSYLNLKTIIILIYIFWIVLLLFSKKIKWLITTIGIILSSIIIVMFSSLEGNDYSRKYVLEILNSSYKKYQEDIKIYNELLANKRNFDLTKEIISKDVDGIYVLIIGESHSKLHSSIYNKNYPRDTMPNLKKRLDNNEMVLFNEVITPYSNTRKALAEVLTLKESDGNDNFYDYPSILDIFKGAGFKTYWISNQDSYGVLGNSISVIASGADETKYTEVYNSNSRKLKKYDEYILPLLDETLKEDVAKKFIVIHLMGSHMQYHERVPKEWRIYKDIPEEFNEWQKAKSDIVNSYDNSIRYVDYLLDEIIEKVKNQNKKSYILYVSDHGQELYDGKNFMGHGEHSINKYVAEVPMFLWYSNDYRLDKEKIENIKKSVARKYSSEDLPYTLMDLSNIEWNKFDKSRSIINSDFKEKVRKHVDEIYDVEVK